MQAFSQVRGVVKAWDGHGARIRTLTCLPSYQAGLAFEIRVGTLFFQEKNEGHLASLT